MTVDDTAAAGGRPVAEELPAGGPRWAVFDMVEEHTTSDVPVDGVFDLSRIGLTVSPQNIVATLSDPAMRSACFIGEGKAVDCEPSTPRESQSADAGATSGDSVTAVRPFVQASGRSVVMADLNLEAVVSTTALSQELRDQDEVDLSSYDQLIVEMCDLPQSIAEIASKLDLSLLVSKILVTDGVARGYLLVHRLVTHEGGYPSVEVLRRLRAGLMRMV